MSDKETEKSSAETKEKRAEASAKQAKHTVNISPLRKSTPQRKSLKK